MPKKLTRKGAVRIADKFFSLYIRELTKKKYGHCPFCGGPIEHCFHFFSRVAYSTRWSVNNAIGSCSGCNLKMEYSPFEFYEWYRKEFGSDLLETVHRMYHTISKYSTSEIEQIGKTFEKMYNELKEAK